MVVTETTSIRLGDIVPEELRGIAADAILGTTIDGDPDLNTERLEALEERAISLIRNLGSTSTTCLLVVRSVDAFRMNFRDVNEPAIRRDFPLDSKLDRTGSFGGVEARRILSRTQQSGVQRELLIPGIVLSMHPKTGNPRITSRDDMFVPGAWIQSTDQHGDVGPDSIRFPRIELLAQAEIS